MLEKSSNHFRGKLLEQFADQATGRLSVRHHRIKELLKHLFQTGGCTLKITESQRLGNKYHVDLSDMFTNTTRYNSK